MLQSYRSGHSDRRWAERADALQGVCRCRTAYGRATSHLVDATELSLWAQQTLLGGWVRAHLKGCAPIFTSLYRATPYGVSSPDGQPPGWGSPFLEKGTEKHQGLCPWTPVFMGARFGRFCLLSVTSTPFFQCL